MSAIFDLNSVQQGHVCKSRYILPFAVRYFTICRRRTVAESGTEGLYGGRLRRLPLEPLVRVSGIHLDASGADDNNNAAPAGMHAVTSSQSPEPTPQRYSPHHNARADLTTLELAPHRRAGLHRCELVSSVVGWPALHPLIGAGDATSSQESAHNLWSIQQTHPRTDMFRQTWYRYFHRSHRTTVLYCTCR